MGKAVQNADTATSTHSPTSTFAYIEGIQIRSELRIAKAIAGVDTIHDLYVWKLSKRLLMRYERVETNVLLCKKKRTVAEIDIIAWKKGEVHVYEVKCSLRLTKAKQQFKKITKHYDEKINKYFLYCGRADQLIEMSV